MILFKFICLFDLWIVRKKSPKELDEIKLKRYLHNE